MNFTEQIKSAYQFKGASILLGQAMQDKAPLADTRVYAPLKTMNRHGLVAGATGTGKTKSLQMLTEGFSMNSVAVVLLDIKGDFSGIAKAGELNEKIEERCKIMNLTFNPAAFPVEFLSLSEQPGARLRATVSEFGPVLLSKILGLNDTQEGVLSMVFKFCDDHQLPLLDLKDLVKVLQFASNEGKDKFKADYGNVSPATVGTIMRQVIALQQQGADLFFGEKSFEVDDLMRISDDGRGMINIIRVQDLQDKPKMFSTFMLQMLAELYGSLPEAGDLDQPKLIMIIDEAHLIFNEASSALLQQLETVIKLIRSKGVGIIFCTQNPADIPQSILGQLGFKIQHALRAFTAKDRQDIKLAAQNYPETDAYEIEELITELGIGESLVTLLDEKGIPTPLVHTMMAPPTSRMNILTDEELKAIINASKLTAKYNEVIDPESAYEILSAKLEEASGIEEPEEKTMKQKSEKSTLETILDNPVARQVGRTAASVLTRTLLGALGLGGKTRRKKSSWF